MPFDEKLLSNLADDAVTAYLENRVPLTDSVKKLASERSFNSDQTARLIEKTNSVAFLRVFPETTEFPPADPSAILGPDALPVKVASAEGEVVAPMRGISKYAAKMDEYQIFGIERPEGIKVASADGAYDVGAKFVWTNRVYAERLADHERQKLAAEEEATEQAEQDLWLAYKHAALSGESVKDIETTCYAAFTGKEEAVKVAMDYLVEKLASAQALPLDVYERADPATLNPHAVVLDSDVTASLRQVFDRVSC